MAGPTARRRGRPVWRLPPEGPDVVDHYEGTCESHEDRWNDPVRAEAEPRWQGQLHADEDGQCGDCLRRDRMWSTIMRAPARATRIAGTIQSGPRLIRDGRANCTPTRTASVETVSGGTGCGRPL